MAVKAAARGFRPRLYAILAVGAALALVACARTPGVDPDDIVSATLAGKPVTPQDLVLLKGWIRRHRSGWAANLMTPPIGCAVRLSGSSDEFELIFFPGPADPGWRRAVLLGRLSSSKGPLVQAFPAQDLASLFQLARAYDVASRPGECG
jgi:hypothetical protein